MQERQPRVTKANPTSLKLNSRAMNKLTFPAPGVAIQITKAIRSRALCAETPAAHA
jgi:hypothetical protein